MEDKYEMDDYGGSSMYEFVPQRYGKQQPNYAPPQPRYAPQQPPYDNRQRYNGGQFVDPVEQLRLLLQTAPIANANAPTTPTLLPLQLLPTHEALKNSRNSKFTSKLIYFSFLSLPLSVTQTFGQY
jgi:hypothetical protein